MWQSARATIGFSMCTRRTHIMKEMLLQLAGSYCRIALYLSLLCVDVFIPVDSSGLFAGAGWAACRFINALTDYNGTRPGDVFVVNFGGHYRPTQEGDETFRRDVFPLLEQMAKVGEEEDVTVVWRCVCLCRRCGCACIYGWIGLIDCSVEYSYVRTSLTHARFCFCLGLVCCWPRVFRRFAFFFVLFFGHVRH